MHASDRRFFHFCQCSEQFGELVGIRQVFRLGGHALAPHPVQVCTSRETLAASSQDHHAGGGIRIQLSERRRQLRDQGFIKRVVYFGTVHPDPGHTIRLPTLDVND